MELKVNEVKLPAPVTFNYEELKQELLQKVSVYGTMVYTEDQVKLAKADRANLNRLKKALNDERIRREKEYMEPFNQFKAQISEIISIIDKPVAMIDKQVKEFEEQQKQEKLQKIQDFWETKILEKNGIKFEQILNPKWLNSSVSMKSIEDEIVAKGGQIIDDLAVVRTLPFYAFEAEQVYLQTLDLSRAVSEAHRLQAMAEKKAAYEAEKAKQNIPIANYESENVAKSFIEDVEKVKDLLDEPVRQWIGFQAFLSVDEAKALGTWLKEMGIKYKAI